MIQKIKDFFRNKFCPEQQKIQIPLFLIREIDYNPYYEEPEQAESAPSKPKPKRRPQPKNVVKTEVKKTAKRSKK